MEGVATVVLYPTLDAEPVYLQLQLSLSSKCPTDSFNIGIIANNGAQAAK